MEIGAKGMSQALPLTGTHQPILDSPTPQAPWRRLLIAVRPQLWRILAALAGMLFSSTIGLALPLLIGGAIGQLLVLHNARQLNLGVLGLLGLCVVTAIGGFLQAYFLGAAGEQVIYDLRTRLYDRLMSLSLDFFARHRTGE